MRRRRLTDKHDQSIQPKTENRADSREITNRNESVVVFDDAVVVIFKSYRVVGLHLIKTSY